jgi:AraC-like DNA-binding protein
MGLLVPCAEFAPLASNIEDATMQLIPNDTEALRVLVNYLSLVREELVLGDPTLRRAVVTHVKDLVTLVLNPHRPVAKGDLSALKTARLRAVLDQLARSFHEPELTLATVAKGQRMSPRYLQRLLETAGTSFTACVNEMRLQRAFALLTQARAGECRISDIALQAGFSDISYFNRLFRSRFGDTPTGVRSQRRPLDDTPRGKA